ncbi:hypothetical protein Ddc_16913 [Ditylenchus destructor]|nr:hypothetical protein Ddc_16913 [Ditylenchus destructor]
MLGFNIAILLGILVMTLLAAPHDNNCGGLCAPVTQACDKIANLCRNIKTGEPKCVPNDCPEYAFCDDVANACQYKPDYLYSTPAPNL